MGSACEHDWQSGQHSVAMSASNIPEEEESLVRTGEETSSGERMRREEEEKRSEAKRG